MGQRLPLHKSAPLRLAASDKKTDPGHGNNKRKVVRSRGRVAATASLPPRREPPATAPAREGPPRGRRRSCKGPRSHGRPGAVQLHRSQAPAPRPPPPRGAAAAAPAGARPEPQLHRPHPARPAAAAARPRTRPPPLRRPPSPLAPPAQTNSTRGARSPARPPALPRRPGPHSRRPALQGPEGAPGRGRVRRRDSHGAALSHRVPTAAASSASRPPPPPDLVGFLLRGSPSLPPGPPAPQSRLRRPLPLPPPSRPPTPAGSRRSAAERRGPTLNGSPWQQPSGGHSLPDTARERASEERARSELGARAGGRGGGRGEGRGDAPRTHAAAPARCSPPAALPPGAGLLRLTESSRTEFPARPLQAVSSNRRAAFQGGGGSGGQS
ncbi:basic proline-rich protein-like [Sagmatias obliquidens]|uniref:basic proline-rich protein-like n=1 Tax=Sagmatias obliquidens TaxID=3371155 RepID=UPI000F4426EC|nr:basic proline-rich protein-like [Lagenorhynchus obliquidens]